MFCFGGSALPAGSGLEKGRKDTDEESQYQSYINNAVYIQKSLYIYCCFTSSFNNNKKFFMYTIAIIQKVVHFSLYDTSLQLVT